MSIFIAVIVLGAIAAIGASALYLLSRRFRVVEDPRIAAIEAMLPGANCGACGMNGCHDAAVKVVAAGSATGFHCPGAGREGMARIVDFIGGEAADVQSPVAVVACAGTPATKTPLGAVYRGPRSCAVMAMGVGDFACLESCLGCGDCVAACAFGAITLPDGAFTPQVDPDVCTGCGKCVISCPRHVISLRPRGRRERRVWVACGNCRKGAVTRRQCSVGCLGCGLCVKACPFQAIEVRENLARIDADKCRACGKCVGVCPTGAIHSNFTLPAKASLST